MNDDLTAEIDALLAGSDQPVEIDFSYEDDGDYNAASDPDFEVMAPPQSKPVEEAGTIELAADPEPVEAGKVELDEDDLLLADPEEAPSPAPKKVERPDRVTAWADCVAEERARTLLGDAILDPIVEQMGKAPKKVADKVYNVLCHLGDRSRLSNFTELAVRALYEYGSMKATELAAQYEAGGYTQATARSQANQQTKALSILGIATYEAGVLTIIPESGVLDILRDKHNLTAAPSPAPSDDDCDEEILLAVDQAPEEAGEEEDDEDILLDS